MKKRIFVMLMILAMIVSIAPSVFAAADTCECGGELTVKRELAATCGSDGFVQYECAVCNARTLETVPATGDHSYVDGICTVCGAWTDETVCTEHNYVVVKEQAPTCVEAGYVWMECDVCGAEKNHEVGEPTGEHTFETVKEIKATCTEAGYVWQECTNPGCDWEKNFEVPALGTEHGETYTDTLLPNCSAEGYIKTYCKTCDALLNEEILPTNDEHFFHNGECQKCGAEEVPGEPAEDPELDDVPKTGSFDLVIVLCGALLTSVIGFTAYYLINRKYI